MIDKHPHTHAQLKQETIEKPLYTPGELKQADERIGIIHLVSGTTAKGEDFYAYVSVRPSLYEEFLCKMADGEKMNVEKFGKVLKKDFGKEPSEEVKRQMKKEFNVDPDFMRHLVEEMEKRRKGKK